jgi:hypothetical protein
MIAYQVNWLAGSAENAFLQATVELPLIDEMLSIDAVLRTVHETDTLFDVQQFFGGPPIEFSIG